MYSYICIYEKGYVSRMFKESLQLNIWIKTQLNMAMICIYIVAKNVCKWPMSMGKCSTSLFLSEMQAKATIRCHYTLTRMATI